MMKSMLVPALVAVLLGPGVAVGEELINRRDEARKAVLASPRNIYRHYCAHCHGEEGKGNGRLWATELEHKPADLTVLQADKSYLIEAIREGSAVHEGKSNLCPPWGRTISAENLDRLAQYILSFGGETEPASAASASAEPGRESYPWFLVFVLMVEVIVLWQMFAKRKEVSSTPSRSTVERGFTAVAKSVPLPYLVAINLTQRCNLNCAHCYMDAHQKNTPQDGELSCTELSQLLDEIGKRAAGTIIVLTGGEPLLRSDIEHLVATGARAGLRMVIGTNGVCLDETRIKRFKQLGLSGVGISLDSVHADQHDAFRGAEGSFEKSCRAIRLCKKQGLHAQLHFTVTRANHRQLEQAIVLGRKLGASITNFFFLVCVGRGKTIIDLTPDQYEESLQEIVRLQDRYRGIMVQTRCAPHFKRILYENNPESPYTRATGYDGGGCLAATRYCRIDPRGEVTPCPYLDVSAGNIRDRPFWQIWEDSQLFDSLRHPMLQGRCGECEFRLLCGGCRARSLVQRGQLMGEDPNCSYIPRGREEIAIGEPPPFSEDQVMWTEEARDRLERIPIFLRSVVEKKLVERAAQEGSPVTREMMQEYRKERERELGIKFE